MRLFVLIPASVACTILLFSHPALAQEQKRAYLDEAEAGPDFQIQGEYVGKIGVETVLGAQVVALGKGKFDAVLFLLGLPGAGWDEKTRVVLSGETRDGATHLTGKNFSAEIRDDKLIGTADEGVPFELQRIVRRSPTLDAPPPANAIVLFDGTNVDQWAEGKIVEDELLGVAARTKQKFRDFTLHIEFRTPFMPQARGQGRGNSGVYIMDQYECQVLDSFGLTGEDNECGGIYKIAKPRINMCFPPLSWQTYDIECRGARFDDAGNKTENAVLTIHHNGIAIHENLPLTTTTPGGAQNDEQPGALFLQNHGDPVRFRNVWIVER